MLKKI